MVPFSHHQFHSFRQEEMISFSTMREIFSTATFRQSGITITGTVLTGILGMLFYILTARVLGPANFGILVVTITTITLVADIANLGTDTGIIRFVSKYAGSEKALKFLKLGWEIKLVVWLMILTVGWVLMPSIASLLTKEELKSPLRLSLIGVGGSLFFSFVTNSLQAYQRFVSWSLLNIGSNSLRLLLILLLIFLNSLDLNASLVIYILVPFMGFFIGLLILPQFFDTSNETAVSKEFFQYNRWIALFVVLAALGSRMDMYLSTKLLSTTQVGIYAAANQLTAVVPQLVFAIATVVAPKLASFNSNKQVIEYLKKLQVFVAGLALLGLLAIPLSFILIPVFFGSSYQESFEPFVFLLLAQLIYLLALPVHQAIFYYFAKPYFFVITSAVHLLLITTLGWFLIVNFGILGAALAVLVSSIFNFIVPAIWVIYKFKKNE